jgi:hypothetical protein
MIPEWKELEPESYISSHRHFICFTFNYDSSQIIRCNCNVRLFLNLQNTTVTVRITSFDFYFKKRDFVTQCVFMFRMILTFFLFIITPLVFVKEMQMNCGFHCDMQSDVLHNR